MALIAAACADPPDSFEGAEALSLLGEPLYPAPASAEQTADVDAARDALRGRPGRRGRDHLARVAAIAYTGLYRDAIEVFTEGIRKHPDDARMYRHRGHRWISVREFDRAIEDLSHAAALVEGMPGRGGAVTACRTSVGSRRARSSRTSTTTWPSPTT